MFLRKCSFNGSFSEEYQQNVVPQSLLALANTILEGPNIKHQSQLINLAASNSVHQLMEFNSVKIARNMNSSAHVHQKHIK